MTEEEEASYRILYSLVDEYQEGLYSSFPLCKGDFEADVPEKLFASWISQKARKNMTPLIIYPQYHDEFIKVVRYLIKMAKIKMYFGFVKVCPL